MEKTIEQEFIEKFDIFRDLFNGGILYLRDKNAPKVYVLKDDVNSDAPKFSIEAYEFTENSKGREKYIGVKSIIDGTKDPNLHKIQKLPCDDLKPTYPYAIYEAFKEFNNYQ